MKSRAQKIPPKHVSWAAASTPVGKVVVGLTDKGEVCRVSFLRKRKAIEVVEEWQAEWKRTVFTAGSAPKDFMQLPLLMIGTEFQKNVWREIMRIPRGQVASYGEIAQRTGMTKAARAVGTACGNNLLAYIVPCHRVVSANGIGGYGSAGLDTKRALLKAEVVSV